MVRNGSDGSSDRLSRRRLLGAVGSVGTVGLAGCGSALAGPVDPREVNIAGSSTVFPVAEAVGSAYTQQRDVTVSISQTGTGGGFSNFFCPGMTHINNASREVDEESEIPHCAENGITPIEFTVATDALTVVVHPEATWVDYLTVEELREIWRVGGAETWNDVRDEWPDEEIERYGADTTSGTFDYFVEAILEDEHHRSDYHATERDRTIVQGVRGSEFAIGYFGFAYYSENPDSIRAVPIQDDGEPVEPSIDTARDGEYTPLSRSLFIYVSDLALRDEPEVRDFVEFFLERSSTDLVSEVGYVPVSEEERDENLEKLEAAVAEVTE